MPSLSKSQSQVEILSGAITLDVFVKLVGVPKQTVLCVNAITGIGETVTVLVMETKAGFSFHN